MRKFVSVGARYFILSLILSISVLFSPWLILICTGIVAILRVYGDMYSAADQYQSADVDLPELHKFLESIGEDSFEIHLTNAESGAVIHRIHQSNIYLVPDHTDPERATDESKAVLAHEHSHVLNNDRVKIILYDSMVVGLNALILGYITPILAVSVLSISTLIIFPLIRNIMKHRFEYRADGYAVRESNISAVRNRLGRNSHLDHSSRIPYVSTHPTVQDRLNRISERAGD